MKDQKVYINFHMNGDFVHGLVNVFCSIKVVHSIPARNHVELNTMAGTVLERVHAMPGITITIWIYFISNIYIHIGEMVTKSYVVIVI